MNRLAVIIVNHNSTDYLRACLASIEEQGGEPQAQLVVVDNASASQDFSQLQDRHPQVRFIFNDENRGFSAACNQGVEATQSRFCLFLNPDCEVRDRALSKLCDFLQEHPQAGIVGGRVLNPDGTLQLACRRSIPRPRVALFRLLGLSRLFPKSRTFGAYNLTYLEENETARVEAVSGSFMAFRRRLYTSAGPMDESFFLYGEDLDFCHRAAQAGWQVFYFPEAAAVHHKQRSALRNPQVSLYHFYHSMRLFHDKHFADSCSRLTNALVRASIAVIYRLQRLRSRLQRGSHGGGSKY
ncbi:MAG TPA: glycosyltransferase family 2 protein [Acidobacteriota bacterium]|nr:glycosyltransferase family 2 protein [Acidobacteriota bacterium]